MDAAASLDGLVRDVHARLPRLGFAALTLGIAPLVNGRIDSTRAVLLSTLPRPFQAAYFKEEIASFDPVFELMASRYQPFTKSSIEPGFAAPAKRRIVQLAQTHAVGEALMVPLATAECSRGVVLFTAESPREFVRRLGEQGAMLHELARALMTRAEALGFAPLAPLQAEEVGLTEREAECLAWCARGRTNDEISAALGISERTVRFHLGNASAKLGTDRRAQAVSRAVRLGLIRL